MLRDVENETLTARMNLNYHQATEAYYLRFDATNRWFALAVTGGGLAGLTIFEDPDLRWLWQLLVLLATLSNITALVMKPDKTARIHHSLFEQWTKLRTDLEILARQMRVTVGSEANDGRLSGLFEDLLRRKAEIEATEPPPNRNRLMWAQELVRAQAGRLESANPPTPTNRP